MKLCFRWCLAGMTVIILCLASQGFAASGTKPTVKLTYWKSIDDLPLYVAKEQGYFDESGVNVELKFIKGEQNALAAALRGDVNGGYISLASLIKLAEKKVPVKVVLWMGHAHEQTKCGIHVGAQTKYQDLTDLKGIRLATGGSINSKTMLTHALYKGDLGLKDIRALWGATPDNPMQYEAALRSGGVDAFIV
ncbi:MAG: hypothetical protein D3926_05775 [Desulfobacteraceae bacterium]|nr:MAG: hypothetical protein D3926_05775 [Desulfobacteraceae bacterium]